MTLPYDSQKKNGEKGACHSCIGWSNGKKPKEKGKDQT